GRWTVPAPGRHNVLNALASIAVGLELGLTLEETCNGLGKVCLPRRRFDRLVDRDDVIVVSDYAHHPSEITALVQAAEHLHRTRILGVFQPHRYSRTLALGPDFPASFKGLQEVVLVPVYAASEQPLPGGSIWDLYGHCRRQTELNVSVAGSLRQAWDYLLGQLRLGDLLLVIGAGDVERIGGWARTELQQTRVEALGTLLGQAIRQVTLDSTLIKGQEPLAGKTTLGVGGRADLWMELGSEQDLAKVLEWTRSEGIAFQVLGGGSNVLVSDLGVRGVVARLSGPTFRQMEEREGVVVAGAGVPLARLLAWAEEHSRAGLEYLEGIPATVGGALRDNAGAFGHAIGDHVAWVRGIDREGSPCTLPQELLDFGYRRCPRLRDLVVVEAAFILEPGDRSAIQRVRNEIAAKRNWMKSIHSAGSVFKNPRGDFAGRLIEKAGLKGYTVGHASISGQHANVMVTEKGARASDVLALMARAREEVLRQFNVTLESEIILME
ncbi:MAG: UDP-N-acetylmuramate dehydrogenase, partial [bacterium]